jgi:CRP/FNR family transcriptional regulator, nitrogen fixation regulation protein
LPHYSANANGAGIADDPSRNVIAIHAKFRAAETVYAKDRTIYCESEPADRIYEVVRGAVRSYKLLSDGRRQICAFHLPNDVFGLEFGPSYRFTAEAVVDTTVRAVRRHSLEYVAATNVGVARDLLSMTANTLRHAEDHLLLLGCKLALERVADFLLEMDKRLEGTGMMALPMSRRDIADYLGLTLETVSRALSHLRDQGVLEFSKTSQREIVLRNRERLRKLHSCETARGSVVPRDNHPEIIGS